MAATEDVLIFKVNTQEAVQSVGDLKNNIKVLKKDLDDLTIGSTEYQEKLNELKQNQNALKDAMYATSGSMEDVAKAASGMSDSYNSLVHKMAALKEEWRATNDEARRNELGKQIGEINQKLKDMDASVGNFQRNVGNYSSVLEGLEKGFVATAGGAGSVINPIKNVTIGFQALSATPVIGILGLLANVLAKVIGNLNSSEENANRMTIALAPLKAGATVLTKVFQFLGDKLADVAEWFTKVLEKMGLVDAAMKEHQAIAEEEIALQQERRKAEMENADAALEVAKLRAKSAEKDKYSAAERLKFIEEAAKKEKEIADRNIEIARREYEVLKRKSELAGNSKEENDKLADAYVKLQNAEANYFNKTRELSAQRVEAINQIKAETKANEDLLQSKENLKNFGISEDEGEEEYDQFAALAAEEAQRAKDEAVLNAMLEGITEKERLQAEAAQRELDMEKAVADGVKEYEEEKEKAREESLKQNLATFDAVASATSGIMNSLADMYESDEENAKKNAKKIKALRIASATIDMLNGAVGAFASAAANPGGIPGMIIGATNAAAVIAMGIANINKIKSANVDSPSENGGTPPAPASVSAPNIDTNLPSVRNVTSASEEDRLNRMASSQKVYILQSDIEAAGNQSKVQVAESSF